MASQNGRRPEFLSLLNSLHPKASKWELLGVAFGLNMDALAIIRANSMEVEVRLKRVLDEVYKTQPELTWKDVIEVLKQPVVSEDVLAQQLEDQLTALKVEKTEVTQQLRMLQVNGGTHGTSPVEIIKRNQAKIRRKFASLVTNVRKKLEAKNIDMNDFSEFILTFFEGDVGQKLVSGSSLTVGDIFKSITKHKLWDYINYYYIEEILEEFGENDGELSQWLRDYKLELAGFKAATKIADFINCCKPSGEIADADQSLRHNMARYDPTYCRRLSIKLNANVAEKGLHYIDDLWKSVADHFLLPSLPVLLESICEGCVEVTWLVPASHAMQIQWNLDGASEFLQHYGIVRLAIDAEVIYDNIESLNNMQLLQACIKGDLDLATALLFHGVDVNEGDDEDGMTPLLCAAREGHVDILQSLLDARADVDKSENNGYTPLMVASVNGRYQVVLFLLQYGANVHAVTKGGWSAINLACQRSHLEVVQLLLQHNASVRATRDKTWTPLMYVCDSARESVEIVELLVKEGANVNYWALDTWSPLKLASERGYMGVAKVLLEHGANVNDRKGSWWTPLYFAAGAGHVEMCRILLKYGAAVESPTGRSPLMVASLNGHAPVVRLLLQHKANIHAVCNNGLSAIHYACHGGHLDVVKLLVEARASLSNVSGVHGRDSSLLMVAAANGNSEIVQYFLDQKMPVHITDKSGCTALVYACHGGHADIVRELLKHGASTDECTSKGGLSPLMVAASNGHVEVVEELLSAGASVNYTETSAGWSPLMVAAAAGHQSVVQLLIEHGADVTLAAKGSGATAHDIASANEQAQVCQELKRHGVTTPTIPTEETMRAIGRTKKNHNLNMKNIQLFKTALGESAMVDVPKTNSSSYQRSSIQLSQYRHYL